MKETTGNKMELWIQYLKERFLLDISMYDSSFLEKTIRGRMAATSSETDEDYRFCLNINPDEPTFLTDQLSNSYSEFFRNPLTFSMLEQAIIPKIFQKADKNTAREIRIWSAGCASGQEPYSLAMLIEDYKINHKLDIAYRIFATDSDEKELAAAKNAIFDFKSIKRTSLDFVEKFFHRSGDHFLVDEKIRNKVDFSNYDLLDKESTSPPMGIYGDFDLIMCCNLLFYYQEDYQKVILQKFSHTLNPAGFLITGEAELGIVRSLGDFKHYVSPAAIFVKS
jgi:chemotaxis methyl-accepting protein methylase